MLPFLLGVTVGVGDVSVFRYCSDFLVDVHAAVSSAYFYVATFVFTYVLRDVRVGRYGVVGNFGFTLGFRFVDFEACGGTRAVRLVDCYDRFFYRRQFGGGSRCLDLLFGLECYR